jgi:hypothetical protein
MKGFRFYWRVAAAALMFSGRTKGRIFGMSKLISYLRLINAVLVVTFLSVSAPARADEKTSGDCGAVKTGLVSLNPTQPIAGTTSLCASGSGVDVKVKVMGLLEGHAYTTWFIYIDKPGMCEHPGVCDSVSDYVGNDPVGVLGRMDSGVVSRPGQITFSTSIPGLRLSPGSQVQIVMFGHGMASSSNKIRARQLLTPQDPGLGSALGAPIDGPVGVPVGISVFTAP